MSGDASILPALVGAVIGALAVMTGAAWATWLEHARRVRSELFVDLLPALLAETNKDIDRMDTEAFRRVARVMYTAGGVLGYRADLLWDFAYMYDHPTDSSHDERYPFHLRGTARMRRSWVQLQVHRVYSSAASLLHFQVQPWWTRLVRWPGELRRRVHFWRQERDFRNQRKGWVRV